jgi:hypothetical protein
MTRRPPVVVEVTGRGRLYAHGVNRGEVERRLQGARDRGHPEINIAGHGTLFVRIDDVTAVREGTRPRRLLGQRCRSCGIPGVLRISCNGVVWCIRGCDVPTPPSPPSEAEHGPTERPR